MSGIFVWVITVMNRERANEKPLQIGGKYVIVLVKSKNH